MADHHAEEDYDGNIFIYRGGRAPRHVTHVRIDKSVDEIEEYAFSKCHRLVQVDTHDGIRKVGRNAFNECKSLKWIDLTSVVEIGIVAFAECENLESVEFGDKLETIELSAFEDCFSLKDLRLPSVITVGEAAFYKCNRLTDIELSERLEAIGGRAFCFCPCLQRIAIPLKRDLLPLDMLYVGGFYTQFNRCEQLTTVDLIGGIHKTVTSLHMEGWKNEMIEEINRINQVLPGTGIFEKTTAIHQWMGSVLDKLDHYKAEHGRYVNEATTLLELALWKAKLAGKDDDSATVRTKKAKVDAESVRREKRITCGADMVIKNVLPFLQLE